MFATTSNVTRFRKVTRSTVHHSSSESLPLHSFNHISFVQAIFESLIDGVVVINHQGDVIQMNENARHICYKLNCSSVRDEESKQFILLDEIWRVCSVLIDSNELFPTQKIIPESEVLLEDLTLLRIRVQWVDPNPINREVPCEPHSYLLVTLEDRGQTIQNLAMTDRQKYGLTARESEVWQLRLLGQSYRTIAARLYITEHTVRKHVKNILSKRRILSS